IAKPDFICKYMRVAIVQDIPHTYSGLRTLAHELAHLLGAKHDGENPAKTCLETSGYLMGTEKNTANKYILSNCTMEQIQAHYK
ncbi:hypothetical protein V5799_032675, partial [Amblyomma americanum]